MRKKGNLDSGVWSLDVVSMERRGSDTKGLLGGSNKSLGAGRSQSAVDLNTFGEEELREYRELFNLIDTDGSGEISREELGNLVKILGIKLSSTELQLMINEIGSTNKKPEACETGEINFEDFIRIMSRRVSADYSAQEVKHAFKVFASEDTPPGHIKVEDLEKALTKYGETKMSETDVKELMSRIQLGGDSLFNYADYVNIMMK